MLGKELDFQAILFVGSVLLNDNLHISPPFSLNIFLYLVFMNRDVMSVIFTGFRLLNMSR